MADSNFNLGGQSFSVPGWAKTLLWILIPVIVIGGGALWAFGTWNSVRKEGNRQEQMVLNAGYKAAQTSLDTCVNTSMQAANIAGAQAQSFKEALTDIVGGRYGSESNPGSAFSAVVEAYPDMAGFNAAFERAFNVAIGCRKDFQNDQNNLQQKVEAFNTWRNGDLTVIWFGDFPNDLLYVDTAKDGRVTGQAALDIMSRPVVSKDTRTSFDTGTREDQPLFPSATPGK